MNEKHYLLFFTISIVFILSIFKVEANSDWLSGWQYRKQHNITVTTEAQTNYTIRINIHNTIGTDSGEDVYIGSKAQRDLDDIRFTNSSGSVLDYWYEVYEVNITENITEWNKSDSNPILGGDSIGPSFASVVKDGSTYWMYYGYSNGSRWMIGRANSTNKIDWTKDTDHNPVLDKGSGGQWDDDNVNVPVVWKEGSTWYILYRGYDGSTNNKIGLANSTNGWNWTRYESNPVISSVSWDVGDSIDPWGIIKNDSTYYLWVNDVSGERKTGLFTSTNLKSWTADGNNPIYDSYRYCSDIFKRGSYYYMLVSHYTNTTSPYYGEIELYRDTSPTFYSGNRIYLGVVINYSETGEWDSDNLDTPWVLTDNISRSTFPDEQLYVYYSGQNSSSIWQEGVTIENDIDTALTALGYKTFYIEIDSIPVSPNNATIYMFYGNSTVSSTSNGTNTFIFFDDFELGNFNRWTIAQSQWSVQNSMKKYGTYAAKGLPSSSNRQLYKTISNQSKGKWSFWLRASDVSNIFYFTYPKLDSSYYYPLETISSAFKYSKVGVGWETIVSASSNTWYHTDILFSYPENLTMWHINGEYKMNDTWTNVFSSNTNITEIGSIVPASGPTGYIDNVRLSKWTYPEPSHGGWGGEEVASPIYSNDEDNSSVYGNIPIGSSVKIYVNWTDYTGLSKAVFRYNVSGNWVNDTWYDFSGSPEWFNMTYTIQSEDIGKTICWNQWANNTFNNWNDTMSEHCFDVVRADGSSCTANRQCLGGYCVHNICRSTSTYCSDTYCDIGESCFSCLTDCGMCSGRDGCTLENQFCYSNVSCCSGLYCMSSKCKNITVALVEEEVSEEAILECPVCPQPIEWSDCINNTQSRINYQCNVETNYICEEYNETKFCEPQREISIYVLLLVVGTMTSLMIIISFITKQKISISL